MICFLKHLNVNRGAVIANLGLISSLRLLYNLYKLSNSHSDSDVILMKFCWILMSYWWINFVFKIKNKIDNVRIYEIRCKFIIFDKHFVVFDQNVFQLGQRNARAQVRTHLQLAQQKLVEDRWAWPTNIWYNFASKHQNLR